MAKRTRRARRHLIRAAIAGAVAIAGSATAEFGQLEVEAGDPATASERVAFLSGVAVLLISGILAVRALASAIRAAVEVEATEMAAVPLAQIASAAGYAVVLLWTLNSLGIAMDALLLGGALTGVALGIAAQQTLGNVFAGVVLLLVRPIKLGHHAVLRTSLGNYEGLVTDMSLFYVSIETESGEVRLPNTLALGSAVGPGARAGREGEEQSQEPEPELPETADRA